MLAPAPAQVVTTTSSQEDQGRGFGWWCSVSCVVGCILCAMCMIGGTISGAFTITMMFEMLGSLMGQ